MAQSFAFQFAAGFAAYIASRELTWPVHARHAPLSAAAAGTLESFQPAGSCIDRPHAGSGTARASNPMTAPDVAQMTRGKTTDDFFQAQAIIETIEP
eukprot:1194485-Prorocentrum_minimum.AAC.5